MSAFHRLGPFGVVAPHGDRHGVLGTGGPDAKGERGQSACRGERATRLDDRSAVGATASQRGKIGHEKPPMVRMQNVLPFVDQHWSVRVLPQHCERFLIVNRPGSDRDRRFRMRRLPRRPPRGRFLTSFPWPKITLPLSSGTASHTGTSAPGSGNGLGRIGSVDSVMSSWTASEILSITICCASTVASQFANSAAASCFSGFENELRCRAARSTVNDQTGTAGPSWTPPTLLLMIVSD